MQIKLTYVVLGALFLMVSGSATAGPADEALATLDLTVLGQSKVYVAWDGSIWEEANNHEGLQSSQVASGGDLVDPDAPILAL